MFEITRFLKNRSEDFVIISIVTILVIVGILAGLDFNERVAVYEDECVEIGGVVVDTKYCFSKDAVLLPERGKE
jgi:hypothetical protein